MRRLLRRHESDRGHGDACIGARFAVGGQDAGGNEIRGRHRAGRSGIYDITVTRQDGTVIAEFRGHSRTIEGELVPGLAAG